MQILAKLWPGMWPLLGALVFAITPVFALPPDPERPFTATTCDDALARLTEARLGNPLISAADMQNITEKAEYENLAVANVFPATRRFRLCNASVHLSLLITGNPLSG